MEQEVIETSRRGFLAGLGALIAAPAIVRSGVLMPLRGIIVPTYYYRALACYEIKTDRVIVRLDKSQSTLPVPRAVLGVIDGERTDRLVSLFDSIIGDVAPGQQRHVDFCLAHASEDHGSMRRIHNYIDEMRVYGVSHGAGTPG